MFEKTLADLIRGIRANKKNEEKYISTCLEEINNEIKSNDIEIKTVAVQKLTYLHMFGYDMSWASFQIIEVMSSSKFSNKRIGYHAAAQSFNQDTDVLMLCTNLIKKDLSSNNYWETSLALNGLSHIVTPDLARDLIDDLVKMINHSKPYIRKRVILLLYKVFLQYPEALIIAYPRLKEKLEDPDQSVVTAAVNVICELATHNPRNYLILAPQLYQILTSSSNNWLLIKVVKLFALLTPCEPRLAKKLLPLFKSLLQTTTATSLLFEIIHTIIKGGMLKYSNEDLYVLCNEKLKLFIQDRDPNLRYLGLLALNNFVEIYPKAINNHVEVIMECLDDKDISIRRRTLDLVPSMITKKNLIGVVDRLMTYLENDYTELNITSLNDKGYRNCIVLHILNICSKDKYANITNFNWYINILTSLVFVQNISVFDKISEQIMDVCIRIREKSIRKYCIEKMIELIKSKLLLESKFIESGNSNVLYVSSYLIGEYRTCIEVKNIKDILFCFVQNEVKILPSIVQNSYLNAILKLYLYWLSESNFDNDSINVYEQVTKILLEKLQLYILSSDIEVQDRAILTHELINTINREYNPMNNESHDLINKIYRLFEGELNPVAQKAQKMVPIPSGLNLDEVINDESLNFIKKVDNDFIDESMFFWRSKIVTKIPKKLELSKKDLEEQRKIRKERKKNNPFYLDDVNIKENDSFLDDNDDIDSIPIVNLSMDQDKKIVITEQEPESSQFQNKFEIIQDEEIPDGAVDVNNDEDEDEKNNELGLLKNLDLSQINDNFVVETKNSTTIKKKGNKKGKSKKEKESKKKITTGLDTEEKRKTKGKGTKKGLKKKTKNVKSLENDDTDNLIKPIINKKQIIIPTTPTKTLECSPVSVHLSVSKKKENSTVVKKGKRNESKELINEYSNIPVNDTNISIMFKWQFNEDSTSIHLVFVLKNNIKDSKIKIIQFEIAETMKVHLLPTNEENKKTIIPAKKSITIEKDISILNTSSLINNVTIPAMIEYQDLSLEPKNHQEQFKIILPLTIYMKYPSFPITSDYFVDLVSDLSKIPYNSVVKVPLSPTITQEEIPSIVKYTSENILNLHVVEVVKGAATLVGETVQGHVVAALLKQHLKKNNTIVITINIKGDNEELVNGLAEISNNFLKSLKK